MLIAERQKTNNYFPSLFLFHTAFSPDGMHMYFAFQDSNVLFDVFRADGLPFNARKLDVKYHADHDAR